KRDVGAGLRVVQTAVGVLLDQAQRGAVLCLRHDCPRDPTISSNFNDFRCCSVLPGGPPWPAARVVPKRGLTVRPQPMCRPPFREKSAPVAKPDSSDASHEVIDAISSGAPRRRTGMVATIFSSTSGRMARTMSVPI